MKVRVIDDPQVKIQPTGRLRADSGPNRAIRQKCLECSNGSRNEVKECPVVSCPLYPYRTGRRATND